VKNYTRASLSRKIPFIAETRDGKEVLPQAVRLYVVNPVGMFLCACGSPSGEPRSGEPSAKLAHGVS